MDRWRGRVALVTGASVGIGAGICRELVKHGMTVIGCARNYDQIVAVSQEDALKIAPGKLVPYKCDLTKEEEILAMFDAIKKQFGHLDVCINNAGLAHKTLLLSGSTAEMRNMLDVNVMALCICTREAVKLMREKEIDDGQVIHISSIGGHRVPETFPGIGFYCGTKFMVRCLTEGLRIELKKQNTHIRIASISPGIVETEFSPRMMKSEEGRDLYKKIESIQPKDIGDAVLYILAAPPHVEIHDIVLRPYQQET